MFLIVHGTAFDIKTDKLMHEHVLEIFVYYTALHGNMKQKKLSTISLKFYVCNP